MSALVATARVPACGRVVCVCAREGRRTPEGAAGVNHLVMGSWKLTRPTRLVGARESLQRLWWAEPSFVVGQGLGSEPTIQMLGLSDWVAVGWPNATARGDVLALRVCRRRRDKLKRWRWLLPVLLGWNACGAGALHDCMPESRKRTTVLEPGPGPRSLRQAVLLRCASAVAQVGRCTAHARMGFALHLLSVKSGSRSRFSVLPRVRATPRPPQVISVEERSGKQ